MSDKKYNTFIDTAGRSIFGVVAEETDTTVKLENPVMIMVQQQENGQMAVQLFPLFFAEFVSPKGEDRNNYFVYTKSSLGVGSDFDIDPRIVEQYERIVNPTLVPANQGNEVAPGAEPEVIKLFDE